MYDLDTHDWTLLNQAKYIDIFPVKNFPQVFSITVIIKKVNEKLTNNISYLLLAPNDSECVTEDLKISL